MSSSQSIAIPDPTAVRVALWRAMHMQVDPAPWVLEDEIGLKLANPDPGWRQRPDMHPEGTRGYRAAILARARYIEDLVLEQAAQGVAQYVILGAGLDTFAQRRPDIASSLRVFEIDKPNTQAWKKQRLMATGLGVPAHLQFVPVDFEKGESWQDSLKAHGFEAALPAIVASTGVSMYLTRKANRASLCEVAGFAPGSTLAMTFLLPLDLVEASERAQHEFVYERARTAGTPFLSFFRPAEILAMAREAGFREVKHESTDDLILSYFASRSDGLRPFSGEEFLVAKT
jgi:methyltransferase (TIGR00027 family)